MNGGVSFFQRAAGTAVLWSLAVLLGLCPTVPAAAAQGGAEEVIGVTEFPPVFAQKGGRQVGILDSVYSPAPETHEVLGRETSWVRIRFEGKPAWVMAKDVLPVAEVLRDHPYQKPLLCPEGLPGVFFLRSQGKPLTLTVERKATLTGGAGVMRLTGEEGAQVWASDPDDDLLGCSPGQVSWPMAAGDLDGDGRPEVLVSLAGEAVPPRNMALLRWTGAVMEKVLPSFYVWQQGPEMPEAWPVSGSPFEGENDAPPPVYRYVKELLPAHFDGSFEALVMQEDRSGGKDEPVVSRGVGLFRLRSDDGAFVLQRWVIPLQ